MQPSAEKIAAGAIFDLAVLVISCVTWSFSSRPRAFLRCFVSRDELRRVARGILKDPNFRREMRSMVAVQFGAGILIAAITIAASWSRK